MTRTYGLRKCWICDKYVSRAGVAWVNHMRMHVRKGEAEEYHDGVVICFRIIRVGQGK